MGLSRNKVAVSEGAAGSPPFYGESVIGQTTCNVNDGRDKEKNEFVVQFSENKELFFEIGKVSVTNAEGPPVPIPNTEVKLCSGENTLRATVREDNSMLTRKREQSDLLS